MILGTTEIIAFVVIIAVAAAICIAAFVIYRLTHPKLKKEEKDEKEYAKEELDRILQPVEDEELSKQINDYKEEDD